MTAAPRVLALVLALGPGPLVGAAWSGPELDEKLAPLRPFVGKTWRGEFKSPDQGRASVDIQRWEPTLGGKAVRIVHSLNQGGYGGETLVYWDAKQKSIAFFYLTTAGFHTQGTISVEEGKFTSREKVTGNADGITEVLATYTVLPDGRLHNKTRFLKKGKWADGHEVTYVEDPEAEVVFR